MYFEGYQEENTIRTFLIKFKLSLKLTGSKLKLTGANMRLKPVSKLDLDGSDAK